MPLGRLGSALRILKAAGCDRLLFVGKVIRPRWRDLSLDWVGFVGLLRVLGGWAHDDRLHRGISGLFERQGIKVLGPADIWPDILAPSGLLTAKAPEAAFHMSVWPWVQAAPATLGTSNTPDSVAL